MKKLLLTFFLIGSFNSSNCIAEEIIRITTGEHPPYLSENLKHNGVGLRIIKEAFALAGVKVEYGFFPWKRSYKLAEQGMWDASATWGYNTERDSSFHFSDPLYPATSAFFHLKSYKFHWNTLDDLKGISIGATATYAYTPNFLQTIKKQSLNIELIASDEANLRKLLKGRIDIFPLNIDVASALLASKFTQQERESITYHPRPLYSVYSYVIFSKKLKKNIRMRELFNKGLKRLKDSGKLNQYFKESQRGDYIIKK